MPNRVNIPIRPVSPSTPVSKKEENVKEVLISYGGGMGGSAETIYAKSVKMSKVKGMYIIRKIDGNTREINPRFVVSIEKKNMITTVTDSQNSNFPLGLITQKWIISDNQKPLYVDNIHHNDNSLNKAKLIFDDKYNTDR